MHLLLLLAGSLNCPVLSTASVSAVLGEVQVSVKNAMCEFKGTKYQLKVDVSELGAGETFASFALRNCPGETVALKGIGNEAVACEGGVVGRVRNQVFVLTLNTKSMRTQLIGLAEQVAGNLF